ncbi:uncharacterized protein LOC133807392 [Humulus lupulus]|uniref:uncharacterized protein LOC133807392 n=1 Tax=Humulus lupulus TaxID=3486 RepID=UPI002B401799|nr:uncharacterized protein LOC133807392 [Humulus lupulus]
MEAYSYSSSSSTSNNTKVPYYSSSLHSVRKSAPAKPWKKPVAPLPPTPPRVYKVDPINFRGLVQKLTAAPEFQLESSSPPQPQLRLQSMAPPPVQAISPSVQIHRPTPEKASSLSTVYKEFSEILQYEKKHQNNTNKLGLAEINSVVGSSFLGLNSSSSISSPSTSHNWCSYLLSPGTLSTMEQSTVL